MNVRRRAITAASACTLLLAASCSSDDGLGQGTLVVRDESIVLCESFDEQAEACTGPVRAFGQYQVLDISSVEMSDFGEVSVSDKPVELVRIGDEAILAFEARPID